MGRSGFDISDLVEVDPALPGRGVELTAHRLTQRGPDEDGDYRYAFTGRLVRTRRWPKGQYLLHLHEPGGLLLERTYLAEAKSTEKGVRHLEGSCYAANAVSAALVFEPYDEDADDEAGDAEAPGSGWVDLPVEAHDEEGRLRLEGEVCQYRTDFQYDNLLLVQLGASVVLASAARFPAEVVATMTVHDEQGRLLHSGQTTLPRGGPRAPRPLVMTGQVYRHMTPARVRVALSCSEPDLPGTPEGAALAPAHGAALLALLQSVDAKLDRLLQQQA